MASKKQENDSVAAYSWDDHNGSTGLENLSQSDLGIPILAILQKGSAEIDEDHEDHESKKIVGAKVGDIINTTSRKILHTTGGNPVKVVPYFYQLVYIEWKPKSAGGGIVATHTNPNILTSAVRDAVTGKDILPNGNNIVTTAYYFVRVLNEEGTTDDALLTFTSTQLKKSRMWLNTMKGFTAKTGNTLPMFHRAYFLSTISESNAKGTWRGWKIEPAGMPLEDVNLIQGLVRSVQASHANATALIGGQSPEDADIV